MDELITGTLEKLFEGTIWAEGPVWIPATQTVRWSDIPNNRILEFHAESGQTREYATSVEFTNGRTLDRDGSVVQCSHGRRRVERDHDGVVAPLVDSFGGHRLNSPNDVVVASDGTVWFTDPPYGILPGTVEVMRASRSMAVAMFFVLTRPLVNSHLWSLTLSIPTAWRFPRMSRSFMSRTPPDLTSAPRTA